MILSPWITTFAIRSGRQTVKDQSLAEQCPPNPPNAMQSPRLARGQLWHVQVLGTALVGKLGSVLSIEAITSTEDSGVVQ
eukprot:gene3839-4802_t